MAQDSPRDESRTELLEWFAQREAVAASVQRQWPNVSHDVIYGAFVDALLQLGKKQVVYDPQRGTLISFLAGATASHVRDYHRSETARRERERKIGLARVADQESPARQLLNEIVAKEDAEQIEACLDRARAAAARTDEERRFLALWEEGVDDQAESARALGVSHRPPAEQDEMIQRTRKRLMKRLERFRNDLRREEDDAP